MATWATAAVRGVSGASDGASAATGSGGAVGAGVGAGIGVYMDKQQQALEEIEEVDVERLDEETLRVNFDSDILFAVDSSVLSADAKYSLDDFAAVMLEYPKTAILIQGHTDSTGSEEHNMELSIRRAQSVAAYLGNENVMPTRFQIMGYGETQPIATNDTDYGRQQNRRVDIAIFANDKLKKVAREKA